MVERTASGRLTVKERAALVKARLRAEMGLAETRRHNHEVDPRLLKSDRSWQEQIAAEDYDPNDWGVTESRDGLTVAEPALDPAKSEPQSEWGWPEADDRPITPQRLPEPEPALDESDDLLDDLDDLDDVDLDDAQLDDEIDLDDLDEGSSIALDESALELELESAEELLTASAFESEDDLSVDALQPVEPAPVQVPPSGLKQHPAAPATITEVLRRELNASSRQTTLRALEKEGLSNVQVLGLSQVQKIVEKAVATAIEKSAVQRSQAERAAIETDANRELMKLLKKQKELVAEKDDSDRRATDLAREMAELKTHLGDAEQALSHEQRSTGPTLAPSDVQGLEQSFKGILSGFIDDERRNKLLADDPTALKGLSDLEKRLSQAFDRMLDRVKSTSEELLERRIDKLNAALEETETAFRRLAQAKGIDGGVASIYAEVQGLDLGALDFERKKDLLAIVFVQNLEIQGIEVTDDDEALLEGALGSLSAPAQQAIKMPEGFAAPLDLPVVEAAF